METLAIASESLYTIEETLAYLKIGRRNLASILKSGEIKSTKVGKRQRIFGWSIHRYLEKNKLNPAEAAQADCERRRTSRERRSGAEQEHLLAMEHLTRRGVIANGNCTKTI